MIELRWVRPVETTTNPDRLQWREVEDHPQGEYETRGWTDVPVVVLAARLSRPKY